ncbi:hypothetical protein [Sedimentibacter sp. B4]|uniref:hypothetical protein n=1 Tax=Sedimentibacter sp. B4 TaxID=304766 RepID=UPI001E290345|nr:hypothetical protein [Sedimentibacter sp. B4]
MLRIDDPFVSNRRVTTGEVVLAGMALDGGERVVINWTAANRDPLVFGTHTFDPVRHAAKNIVYGIGPHVCPGALWRRSSWWFWSVRCSLPDASNLHQAGCLYERNPQSADSRSCL